MYADSTLVAAAMCEMDEEGTCSAVVEFAAIAVPCVTADEIVLVIFNEFSGAHMSSSVAEVPSRGKSTEAFWTGEVGAGSINCDELVFST